MIGEVNLYDGIDVDLSTVTKTCPDNMGLLNSDMFCSDCDINCKHCLGTKTNCISCFGSY